jgi:hypothetical protein
MGVVAPVGRGIFHRPRSGATVFSGGGGVNSNQSTPEAPRSDGPEVGGVPERFRVLPERVKPEDWVIEVPAEDPPDPEGGRDTDRDFVIRFGGP